MSIELLEMFVGMSMALNVAAIGIVCFYASDIGVDIRNLFQPGDGWVFRCYKCNTETLQRSRVRRLKNMDGAHKQEKPVIYVCDECYANIPLLGRIS